MTNEGGFRTVDIDLNQEAVDALGENVGGQSVSANSRLSVSRLLDSFDQSPSEMTRKLLDNLRRVKVYKGRHQVVKRVTIRFKVDDLSRLDSLVLQLKQRTSDINRQDLVRLGLLLWRDLAWSKSGRRTLGADRARQRS